MALPQGTGPTAGEEQHNFKLHVAPLCRGLRQNPTDSVQILMIESIAMQVRSTVAC